MTGMHQSFDEEPELQVKVRHACIIKERWQDALLMKFPVLDLTWPLEIIDAWMQCFKAMWRSA